MPPGHATAAVRTIGDVRLPAHPDQGQAEPLEQAVAKLLRTGGIPGEAPAVEVAQGGLAAPVADLQKGNPAPARGILGLEDLEAGPAKHAASGGTGRLFQVDDAGIEEVVRIEAEADPPRDLLVGSRGPEGPASEDRFAREDLQPGHLGRKRRGKGREKKALLTFLWVP
ncbi:MAG: hypothetical protein ACE5H3_11080, partial [Planctomycetota bacterium]